VVPSRPSLRPLRRSVAAACLQILKRSVYYQSYGIRYERTHTWLGSGLQAQETLLSIQDKADAITRRSAGIPALMASIMAADPGKLFSRAMSDLVAEASVEAKSANIEESRLPQVHALNCIKEFFTTSRLNVASEAYIGQGLELAARTLNSNM
jgi:hypothetical protein